MHWLKEETMSKKINTIYFTSILIGIAVFAGGCFKAGNTQAAQSLRAEVIQTQEETSQDSAAAVRLRLAYNYILYACLKIEQTKKHDKR